MELFPEYENPAPPNAPLAERMRPSTWEEFAGQEHLVGEGRPLRKLISQGSPLSFILWGPPGSGKTTLARLAARLTKSEFHEISAVHAGVQDIRKVIAQAERIWKTRQIRSILFIDEIHRFNKAQQDAVLPFVENGTLHLIGSTTENPSLEVIPALRSRCQIFRLQALERETIRELIQRALHDSARGLGESPPQLDSSALNMIERFANGDARRALNVLEAVKNFVADDPATPVDSKIIEGIIQETAVLYEKGGTEHYDHASAFQKSLRGSDADAAIYWLAKMIAGGEDPKFIVRRLLVTASEDVGNADPMALCIANAAAEAVDRLGMPEARIALSQAVIYIARAPKDNSAIVAIDNALNDIQQRGDSYPVPDHLKDTHYKDAKNKYGYGVGYKYPHDYPGNKVDQQYLPDPLIGKKYVPPKSTK